MAWAVEPVVLETGVRLAPEMRAALVQRPDVQRGPVAGLVLALEPAAAPGIDDDDECLRPGDIPGEALADRQDPKAVRNSWNVPILTTPPPAFPADQANPMVPATASTAQRPSAAPIARRNNVRRENP